MTEAWSVKTDMSTTATLTLRLTTTHGHVPIFWRNCSQDADNIHERVRHHVLTAPTPLILLSNMAVLGLLLCHRHSSRPDLLLMASLCCADLAVGATCIATLITKAAESSQDSCLLRLGLGVAAVMASILSLLAVACDRLLAIVRALRYGQLVTTARTMLVILLLWTFSLLFGLLPVLGWRGGKEGYTSYCAVLLVFPASFVAAIFVLSVLAILAILLIHAYLCLHAHVHIRRIDALEGVLSQQSEGVFGLSGRSLRSMCTVSLVAGCVVLCWCPFLLVSLYVLLAPRPPCVLNIVAGTHLLMLGYVNSALNPVVYVLRNRELRAMAATTCTTVCQTPV